MFDIGFLELILVSIVGLLVLGPERLPGAIRTVSLYVGRMRRSFNSMRAEIERELQTDEIRRQLHNEEVMQKLREAESEVRKTLTGDADDRDHSDAGKEQTVGPQVTAPEPSASSESPEQQSAASSEEPLQKSSAAPAPESASEAAPTPQTGPEAGGGDGAEDDDPTRPAGTSRP